MTMCACGHAWIDHKDRLRRFWVNAGVCAGACRHCECSKFKEKKWDSPKNETGSSMSPPLLPSPSQLSLTGRLSRSQFGLPNPSASQNLSRPDKPFVGYRAWIPMENSLLPLVHAENGAWKLREINEARCVANEKHVPAEPNCHCGFWTIWDLRAAIASYGSGNVVGAVLGWGRVQRHSSEGFRAQYAQIIGLAFTVSNLVMGNTLTIDTSTLRRQQDSLKKIAELADVPLLSPPQLIAMARSQGLDYEASKGALK